MSTMTMASPEVEVYVTVGPQLKQKRLRLGWQLRYAAARLGFGESALKEHEEGFPIAKSRYQRVMRVYNRAFYVMTQGMARQAKGVFR